LSLLDKLLPVEKFFFLLLYAPVFSERPEPIQGGTWLQKEMYVISKNFSLMEEAAYESYRYGSFSEIVDEIKDQYQISRYLEKTNGSIRLTAKGEKTASEIWQGVDDNTKRLVQDIKREYNDMKLWELLLFMYVTYPETAENSDVKDKVLRNRLQLAQNLLKRKKVSLQKAAELAGVKIEDFIQQLKKNNKEP